MPIEKVIEKYKPTILLGMTGVGGLFTEGIIKKMAEHCDRPIIFPLSNPTTKAECTAEQAFTHSKGKCIFASGSPFDPVTMEDGSTFYPTQCNNSEYLFFKCLQVNHIFELISTLYSCNTNDQCTFSLDLASEPLFVVQRQYLIKCFMLQQRHLQIM